VIVKHRRTVSMRPEAAIALRRLSEMQGVAGAAIVDSLIMTAANLAGILVTDDEVERFKAANVARREAEERAWRQP